MIVTWDDQYTDDVLSLWNREAVAEGYKELTEARFTEIFRSSPYFDRETAFVLLREDQVIGFACGCTGEDLPLGKEAGYITCILVSSDYRSDDLYKLLLNALEQRFIVLGKKQADFLFFNPMQLPWYIPGTPKHEHNNAPGVPIDGSLYPFLLDQGYRERARENAMYLQLAGFSIPQEILAKEAHAADAGYRVELYDSDRIRGLEPMLASFNNPLWEKEIKYCTHHEVPVVIASKNGLAVGFAGPVIRQENGRGYFTGIGVHAEHEGHGLGSILFFKLCETFRDLGTEYMSLYTGSTNPAIRIYEKAGFTTVKQFGIMRRELL